MNYTKKAIMFNIELLSNLLLKTRNFYYKLLAHLILRLQITRG